MLVIMYNKRIVENWKLTTLWFVTYRGTQGSMYVIVPFIIEDL